MSWLFPQLGSPPLVPTTSLRRVAIHLHLQFCSDLAQVVRYDTTKFLIANECFNLSNSRGILFCRIGNVAIVVFMMGLVFPEYEVP